MTPEEIKETEEDEKVLKDIKVNDSIREENDVRIAVVGNVDSGKSTLVGVLTKGVKDDGRGSARATVFNTELEKTTGRTTDIAKEIMGFDEARN